MAAAAAKAKVPSIKDEVATSGKIYVEGYGKEAKEPVVINVPLKDGNPSVGVYIGSCSDCTIQLTGKSKNITISGCKNVNVVFENCITMCEVIRCERSNIQGLEAVGTFQIDKCDRVKVYLPDASLENQVVILSAQSTSTNVYYSTPDGEDQIEYALPEQLQSVFKKGVAPVTTLGGEMGGVSG